MIALGGQGACLGWWSSVPANHFARLQRADRYSGFVETGRPADLNIKIGWCNFVQVPEIARLQHGHLEKGAKFSQHTGSWRRFRDIRAPMAVEMTIR